MCCWKCAITCCVVLVSCEHAAGCSYMPATSLSMRRSTISTVLSRGSPDSGSVYCSVRLVTVSPTSRSDSITLVSPGLDTTSSRGKSSELGLRRPPCWRISPQYLSYTIVPNTITANSWRSEGISEKDKGLKENYMYKWRHKMLLYNFNRINSFYYLGSI